MNHGSSSELPSTAPLSLVEVERRTMNDGGPSVPLEDIFIPFCGCGCDGAGRAVGAVGGASVPLALVDSEASVGGNDSED